MVKEYRNLIGGEWVAGADQQWAERSNPADTDELVARFPLMGEADVVSAVDAAVPGFRRWSRTNPLERAEILQRAASLLTDRAEQIAHDLTREMGKTRAEAHAEVQASSRFFAYNAGLARGTEGDRLADRRPGTTAWSQREPLGIVALITPWNDPLATPCRKLGPALLCGNSVVLKPATHTPMTTFHLAQALQDSGLPDGVLNVVTGPGTAAGRPLIASPSVAAISFTGSTTVGTAIKEQVGGRQVRVQTEMGGKNAVLVLRDADLDLAADAIGSAAWGQAGQRCTAISRLVVEAPVHDDLLERLTERAESLVVGPGLEEGTQMGPLVSAEQLDAVAQGIEKAREQGATVVTGGERLDNGDRARGHFMSPCVMTVPASSNLVWQEELFGPVLAVREAASLDQGIEMVNDSRYGLAAGIFTDDLSATDRFCDEVDAGQVVVNLPTTGWDAHVPFGGFKDSGSGFKEQGLEGPRFYSRVKSVVRRAGGAR